MTAHCSSKTLKSATGSDAQGRVQESSKDRAIHCPLLQCHRYHHSLGNNVLQYAWRIAKQGTSLKPWCPNSSLGLLGGWLQSPASAQAKLITTWLKDSPLVTMYYFPSWSKSSGKKTLLSNRTFKGLREDFPEAAGKDQVSLWTRFMSSLCTIKCWPSSSNTTNQLLPTANNKTLILHVDLDTYIYKTNTLYYMEYMLIFY